MNQTKELIEALNLEFDRYLRIGVTGDGDYYVQLIRIDHSQPAPVDRGETILAECDGGLDTCLRSVLAMVEDENYDHA